MWIIKCSLVFFAVSCFYKPADVFNTSKVPNVVFENNTANYAGNVLYGGWIDFCVIIGDSMRPMTPDFDTMFQVNGGDLDSFVIASNPLRGCLCVDSKPECSITHYNISAYPSTTVQIPVAGVGQRFGTVPSIVYSDFEEMNGIQQDSRLAAHPESWKTLHKFNLYNHVPFTSGYNNGDGGGKLR